MRTNLGAPLGVMGLVQVKTKTKTKPAWKAGRIFRARTPHQKQAKSYRLEHTRFDSGQDKTKTKPAWNTSQIRARTTHPKQAWN
jgi:hypothetical protein